MRRWLARLAVWFAALVLALACWAAFIRATAPVLAALPPPNVEAAVPAIAIAGDPEIAHMALSGAAAAAFVRALAETIGEPVTGATAVRCGLLRSGRVVILLTHRDGSCTSVMVSPELWQQLRQRLPSS